MNKRNKTLFYIIGILIVVVLGISISYAFFTSGMSAGEDNTSITSNAGVMKIVYDGGSKITANKLLPNDEAFATKVFTVTGTNTTKEINMPYEVKLVVDNNTFKSPISYTLTGENTGSNGTIISDILETNITGTSITLGTGSFKNASSKVHTYTLKLFYKDTNTDQSADMGANIKVHIEVTGAKGA